MKNPSPWLANDPAWEKLSYTEKNRELYLRQKALLDLFLEKKAITQAQHDKSLRDLTEKMKTYTEDEKS